MEDKKERKAYTFYQQVTKYFFMLILIPTLIMMIMFVVFLDSQYILKNVRSQQNSMESYIAQMDLQIRNVNHNVSSILRGDSETNYYMTGLYSREDMVYTLIKHFRPLCSSIYASMPIIESMKIYVISDVMYIAPFASEKEIPLEKEMVDALESAEVSAVLWNIVSQENGEFPSIYSYQKIYNQHYSRCLGYLELKFDSGFFVGLLDALSGMANDRNIQLLCEYEGEIVYQTAGEYDKRFDKLIQEEGSKEKRLSFTGGYYGNRFLLDSCGLEITGIGKWAEFMVNDEDAVSLVMILVIIICLGVLYLFFFHAMRKLSERIFMFAHFLEAHSNENLLPYSCETEEGREYKEITTLVNSYNTLVENNHTLIEKVKEMEALSQEARYQALQSQIQPHFVYGTLETIRMMALGHQDMDVAGMTYALSRLMRSSVFVTSDASTLGKEFEIVKNYLEIQKIRFSNRLRYQILADDGFSELTMPSFTLQPIVENAVSYGGANTFDAFDIIISVTSDTETGKISISVGNTGKLIEHGRMEEVNRSFLTGKEVRDLSRKGNGIALQNIYRRLRFFMMIR